MEVYPIRDNWRKFRPHLSNPGVRLIENAAMRSIHHEYDAGRHIPREAGSSLDVAWPRSRTGATAYQCFGYCHVIAPVMLALAKLAEPKLDWYIIGAREHTAVVSLVRYWPWEWSCLGYLLDINLLGDSNAVEHFEGKVWAAENWRYDSPIAHVEGRLQDGRFRSRYPMRTRETGWNPAPGTEALYPAV